MIHALRPLVAVCCIFAVCCSPARRAVRDVRAGHAQLLEAGTVMLYVPGVDPHDPLVNQLPHRALPNGCTNNAAMIGVRYAEEYNAAVIKEIRKRGAAEPVSP